MSKLRDLAVQRKVSMAAEALQKRPDRLSQILPTLTSLESRRATYGAYPSAADEVADIFGKQSPPPIPTGIAPLDEKLLGGLMPESLSVLCAGTGRGKTGLVVQISLSWLGQGWPVLFIETELDPRQMYARFLAQRMGRPWLDVFRMGGPEHREELVALAREHLSGLALRRRKQGQDLPAIVAGYMAQYRRRPLVVVDHIGDLARTLGLHDMRVATARIVDQLKGLTEQGLTVLAVSQVARAVISDPNATRTGRSYEGAAKDAGEVEEGAATLLYLNTEPTEPNGTASAQLHIAKSRGAPGNEVVGLRFYGALGCFEPDTLAELPKAQKEVLQAIASLTATGGYASVDGLKVKLRWGQDKINPILRTLADRRLIKRDKRGISLTPSEVQS